MKTVRNYHVILCFSPVHREHSCKFRSSVLAFCVASWVFSVCSAAPDASGEQKPNVVLIVADDLGYGDVGCYGSELNKTPHIDALAASGMRFTDFHSAGPMCSPTRAAMLTGQYQQRFGRMFDQALWGGGDVSDRGLPHEAVTIAEVLKKQGYATACFGKWHLGYVPPWLPASQGFDVFRGLASGDGDFHTHISRRGREDWWHNDRIEIVEGYTTDLLTQYSVDLLPTMATLAEVDRDEFLSDGVDLGPHLFLGRQLPNRMLFLRAGAKAAVRSGPWKLCRKGKQMELYNLDDDLGEQHDLAAQRPQLVKQLTAAWARWQADVNQSAEKHER